MLGPVILIQGGKTEKRGEYKRAFANAFSNRYPYWTETFDPKTQSLAMVFATTAKEAWSVSLAEIYTGRKDFHKLSVFKKDLGPVPKNKDAPPAGGGEISTFGFCYYP